MTNDIWSPDYLNQSLLFDTIRPVAENFKHHNHWPGLLELENLFSQYKLPIKPVPQSNKPTAFEEYYEPRVFLKGELQTRTENWHDFFNAMIWLSFPKTKTTLNQLHYHAAKNRERSSNRSALENAITLFDECGIVIIADNNELLDLIRNHEWKALFINHRHDFGKHIQCHIFGHAMYEKALSPYIGMTAQALLIHTDTINKFEKLDYLDEQVSQMWQSGDIDRTKALKPFPLLGVPGWYPANEQNNFYDNEDYFRPLRTTI